MILFQYPLVDRVGFEGPLNMIQLGRESGFSILWWIELVLRDRRRRGGRSARVVSVSSGGSSWF